MLIHWSVCSSGEERAQILYLSWHNRSARRVENSFIILLFCKTHTRTAAELRFFLLLDEKWANFFRLHGRTRNEKIFFIYIKIKVISRDDVVVVWGGAQKKIEKKNIFRVSFHCFAREAHKTLIICQIPFADERGFLKIFLSWNFCSQLKGVCER
jgi:hypothetical protein